MSFSTGSSAQQSEINVTPLIDVLLVLLIIFMVIVPVIPNGLKALSPQPAKTSTATPPDSTIVVQVLSHTGGVPTYRINEQPIAKDAITSRLTEIFAMRQQRVMFVKGDADLQFASIAEVVGFGHKAQVDNIGVLTPKTERRE